MQAVAPEAGIVFEDRSEFAGLNTAETAEVTLLAKQLSGRNSHSKVAYGTEAGLFSDAGVPTIVIGPGSIDQAHKADAFIIAQTKSLNQGLLEALCVLHSAPHGYPYH